MPERVRKAAKAAAGAGPHEKYEAGKALRTAVPRESHAELQPKRAKSPIEILRASDSGRLEELLWIRYARMASSPFAFYRGAAAVMAYDLAPTPATGLRVQLCGDAHLMNFGGFGTPERNLIFDINDFDETLAGPWEWDVKRLAASVAIAANQQEHRRKDKDAAVLGAVRAYREAMRAYAAMPAVEIWYSRIDATTLVREVVSGIARSKLKQLELRLRKRTSSYVFPKLTRVVDGQLRIVDDPPLIFHQTSQVSAGELRSVLETYRASLPPDRQLLFDRYRFVDYALKVVGVGSVGTRCYIGLFMASHDDPLILQAKEARDSVLAPYCGASPFANAGERVVVGQRVMQAGSDIFLGWTQFAEEGGRTVDYYMRQLRDMKTSANVEGMTPPEFARYVQFCGHALARAHAKSGEPATIAGYLGNGAAFDRALLHFADAYAELNLADHGALLHAIANRIVPTKPDGAAEET